MKKKKMREREREREKEGERNNLLCVGKLCIEWESELQTYSKGIWIRRAKNKRKIKE